MLQILLQVKGQIDIVNVGCFGVCVLEDFTDSSRLSKEKYIQLWWWCSLVQFGGISNISFADEQNLRLFTVKSQRERVVILESVERFEDKSAYV